MSGSASSALAFAPVFVVQFGGRRSNNRSQKRYHDANNNWHVCDSLCLLMSSALSFNLLFLLLIFLVTLCSLGGGNGVKGSEIAAQTSSATLSNTYNGIPAFDATDLKNLIEIFPEFREYVYKIVSSQAKKQQHQTRLYENSDYVTITTTPVPIVRPISGTQVSPTARQDFFSIDSHPNERTPAINTWTAATSKDSYEPQHYYHNYYKHHDHYGHDHHGYPGSNHGYGYGSPSNYGWSSSHNHHETYKDPKHHFEVGYQLGKDLSCVLNLLGFKSIKDFSIHSIFSFFKKIKYLILIGLAFKLGVLLSPLALPTLLPLILLAVIAKILPLLLIVVLLFKLLKAQFKFGIGKRNGKSVDSMFSFLEETNISRLWKSIEEATQNVTDNDSCVEKIICEVAKRSKDTGGNSTVTLPDSTSRKGSERSIETTYFGSYGQIISKVVLK